MTDAPLLYNLPLYYDVAFSWDVADEVAIVQRAIADHARPDVRRILEPACGTGRLLIPLAMQGYELLGYDLSESMVEYTRQRVGACGLADRITVEQGDMTTAIFRGRGRGRGFDAAYNLITSISHLTDDGDLVAHLSHTAASLQRGGIYLVQFGGVWDPEADYEPERWTTERDGLRIDSTWSIDAEDPARGLRYLRCHLSIHDNGRTFDHDQVMPMRLWTDDTWRRLLAACNDLERAGAYTEWHEPIDADQPLAPEHGNAYLVLRRK